MAGFVPAISTRMAQCPLVEIAGTSPAMTLQLTLARIPHVGYDFGKKNTNAEKGELT